MSKRVEFILCHEDNTWSSKYLDVPDSTKENEMVEWALSNDLHDYQDLIYVGILHIEEKDD